VSNQSAINSACAWIAAADAASREDEVITR
jgi:hypothetical protein